MNSNADSNPDEKPELSSPHDFVLEYIRRGWNPVPIPFMTKGPKGKDWGKRRIDMTNVNSFFPVGQQWNVGVQLGPTSGNLIDVDLDCPEALALADWFFPQTQAVFGRQATPTSHRLYISPELVATAGKAALQFEDPDAGSDKGMLIELRCGGGGKAAQTVFPGSVHPSSQPVAWARFDEAATVPGDALLESAKLVAAACLLVRGFPGQGLKHNAALVLSGFLVRLGWSEDKVHYFLEAVFSVAGANTEALRCVATAFERFDKDEPLAGYPKLKEVYGDKRAKKIAELLGYKDKTKESPASNALMVMEQGDVATFREHPTDLGNSEYLVRLNAGDIRYCSTLKTWFIWAGNYWERDENGEVMRRAERAVQTMFQEAAALPSTDESKPARVSHALRSEKRQRLTDMVALAQVDARAILDYKLLDADPLLVGVLNGVVDLRTGEFREGRREDFITMRCDVNYDPSAECPNWLAFQDKISGMHPGLIDYKQKVFGLLLSGEVPEILWICHGIGSNGKTTELETVSDILGEYAMPASAGLLVAPKQSQSEGATPELVQLRGKRAVFVNETAQSDWLNEERVKYISATDMMTGRNLFEKTIKWKPTHKPFLRTNHRPRVKGVDDGIWRRINYVPYSAKFSAKDKIMNYRENYLLPEKAGIFNWMLVGFLAYVADGRKLNPPNCVQESNESYRKDSNITGKWIDAAVEHAPGEKTSLKELHAAYVLWFRDEVGEKGYIAIQTLGDRLCDAGFVKGEKTKSHSSRVFFLDTRLKPTWPEWAEEVPTDGIGSTVWSAKPSSGAGAAVHA
jgi:P4 family phage/plasmid primase-like protien